MKNTYIIIGLTLLTSTYSYSQKKQNKTIRVKEYHKNGQLKSKGKKKFQMKLSSTSAGRTNGIVTHLKQGRWIEYYDNGNKKRIIFFEKGELVKEHKTWKEDGTKN